jgi:DNA invertase Pin-like site-specific DNA recombinase
MESGVGFVAVDNPHANKLTVHILAAAAQHEREIISERNARLAGREGDGEEAGQPRLAQAAKLRVEAVKAAADQFAANVLPVIHEIQKSGATSANAIGGKLNERGVRLPAAGSGPMSKSGKP